MATCASSTEGQPIVLDHGSHSSRVGFAGPAGPSHTFRTLVGRPKSDGIMVGMNLESFAGDDALAKRGALSLKYPIEHGIITNWDDMEKLWTHTFYDVLHVLPEDHPVLLTEPTMNPKANRERMTQMMFETFNVPALYLKDQAFLSLFHTGRTSGVVLDIGETVADSTPVFEGCAIPHAVGQVGVAGDHVTSLLRDLLTTQRHYSFFGPERGIVKDIKQALCYVALSVEEELKLAENSTEVEKAYELPDGQIITVGKERFQASEALFDPTLVGRSCLGIHQRLHNSIGKCDEDIRSSLYQNIVLSGGTTMLPGLAARLTSAMQSLAPASQVVEVCATEDRLHGSWTGGSILASLTSFGDLAVSKNAYDEEGPSLWSRRLEKK